MSRFARYELDTRFAYDRTSMSTLILLRHGQSQWNLDNRFTGWVDVDLTELGEREAVAGGELMLAEGLAPAVLHTSLQKRAIRTAELALRAMDRQWIPVRRSWRLNERHYGGLQGLNKKETADQYGADQVKVWRRAYAIAPPELGDEDFAQQAEDPRYADLPRDVLPRTECLADVVERMMPYWYDGIVPDLEQHGAVLVAAHGNSLRALVKHLDGISDDDIVELNIPTGVPLVYELDERAAPAKAMPLEHRYLGDPEAAKAKAEAVAKQAG
jgi:2,3-bisphosphoglycerate-dependent phosphoglycerate mutase